MGKSYRKTSRCGMSLAESEKQDKVLAHKAQRRIVNQEIMGLVIDPDEHDLPHPKEFGNPWSCAKDGRPWFDKTKHPKLMRK